MSIAVALIVPLLLGVGVDALLHTSPIGVLIGLLVGITASLLRRVRAVQALRLTQRWVVSRGPIDIVASV